MASKSNVVLMKILKHTASIIDDYKDCRNCEDFEVNPMRVEATVFNLMQIGELAMVTPVST